MTASAGSVTTPWMEVRNCACAGAADTKKAAVAKTMAKSERWPPKRSQTVALKFGIDEHTGILSKAVKALIALSRAAGMS